MFSILIHSQNQEINLAAYIDSIIWCDDIWILDSSSPYWALGIAERYVCHIVHRKVDNFGDQLNYAIDTKFKNGGILDFAANERFTSELWAECDIDDLRQYNSNKIEFRDEQKDDGYYVKETAYD